MKNKQKNILSVALIILLLFLSASIMVSCDGSRLSYDQISGFYISYSDLKPVIAGLIERSKLTDKSEFKENLFKYPKDMEMIGYNFTFLCINEKGEFYHHFSKKDERIIQDTIGKVSLKSEGRIELKGETTVTDKQITNKEPFRAVLSSKTSDNGSVSEFKLDYLDIKTPIKRLYATTGYLRMTNIDEMMSLGFESIRFYKKNLLKKGVSDKFPEVEKSFSKAYNNIDTWMSVEIEGGFYKPVDDDEKSFLYIDKESGTFMYLTLNNPLYGELYVFEGPYSLEGNLIVTNKEKDFMPFSLTLNGERSKANIIKSSENVSYIKYEGDDYIDTLDDAFVTELKSRPFMSSTLNKLVENVNKYEDQY